MKKIAVIGSTSYREMMQKHTDCINETLAGTRARMATFDDVALPELEVCKRNREMIKWADEVDVFWDQRSAGTIFDLGMCFAMRKKIQIQYLGSKTFSNLMGQMEEEGGKKP